uniref:Uncharacterized protein n=1 Tax=Knipowitschia caucasica TaxID=637954 RepID=A0AAV2J832_KNICA
MWSVYGQQTAQSPAHLLGWGNHPPREQGQALGQNLPETPPLPVTPPPRASTVVHFINSSSEPPADFQMTSTLQQENTSVCEGCSSTGHSGTGGERGGEGGGVGGGVPLTLIMNY